LVHWFCSRISSPALTTVHIFLPHITMYHVGRRTSGSEP
jgi:hypothetical protein